MHQCPKCDSHDTQTQPHPRCDGMHPPWLLTTCNSCGHEFEPDISATRRKVFDDMPSLLAELKQ